MNITRVVTSAHSRYIPIKGLEGVETVLNTFARGITKGAKATENHQVKAIGESRGGLGLAFYVLSAPHMQPAGDSFVRREIMLEAISALKHRERWSQHFDYDGQGVFFKTTVEIEVLDRDEGLYGLGIYAAYVGDEPEKGLADHLGVSRALIWASVEVETMPVNRTEFEFDFEQIVNKLDDVLPTHHLGTKVASAMMGVTEYGESRPTFRLFGDKDIEVTIHPGDVEHRFDYSNKRGKEPDDTWTISGSVLRGRLRESYSERGKLAPPTLVLSLAAPKLKDAYGATPIWKEEKKQALLALRDQIAKALASPNDVEITPLI